MGKGMRAGRKPRPAGGGNMQKQVQAMQAMQAKMEALQEEINEMETTASSGRSTARRKFWKSISSLKSLIPTISKCCRI